MNPDIEDATVVSESPVTPEIPPQLTDEQYNELLAMRDALNALKTQGYEFLRFLNRAHAIIQQAEQVKAQLEEATQKGQENENQINEGEAALVTKMQEFLRPFGLENTAVEITDTTPHFIIVQPHPSNQAS